jgi:hypothetical protein
MLYDPRELIREFEEQGHEVQLAGLDSGSPGSSRRARMAEGEGPVQAGQVGPSHQRLTERSHKFANHGLNSDSVP